MSRRAAVADPRQMDLWQPMVLPPPPPTGPGSLALDGEIRATLASAIKAADCSREEIAARMQDLTRQRITRAMLDAWTAPSHSHRFPCAFGPAFARATGTFELQHLEMTTLGGIALFGRDALEAQVGRLDRIEREIGREKRKVQAALSRAPA